MVERVARFIHDHAMFGPGERIGVAVSGGADSVALLYCLLELAPAQQWKLTILHLDHCLRGAESAHDAAFVRDLARRLGLPCESGRVEVARLAGESRDNLEQAARRARYEFLGGFIDSGKVRRVALGHTLSDQAETVLFRFLRGAGTAGLAGIRPVTRDGFVRPLLAVTRPEIERYLHQRGIEWREDSSNRDTRFARNRIRHQLLPQLRREWNPALPETLARMARVATEEENYWAGEMDRLAAECFLRRNSAVLLRLDRVRNLPRAVLRRLVRRAVREATGAVRGIDFRHVERVVELVESPSGEGGASLPGLQVTRSLDWVRFASPEEAARSGDYSIPLAVPGRFRLPHTDRCLQLELTGDSEAYSIDNRSYNTKGEDWVDWRRLSGPLELRNWRPGDRFRKAGAKHRKKMKILFAEARVPSWDRHGWPIISCGETIVWSRKFGVAEGFAPTAGHGLVLRVQETGYESED